MGREVPLGREGAREGDRHSGKGRGHNGCKEERRGQGRRLLEPS